MEYDFYKKWDKLRINKKDFLTVYKSDRNKCRNEFLAIMDIFCDEYGISYKSDETEMSYIAEVLARRPSHRMGYVELALASVCEETADNPCTFVGHCLTIAVKSGNNTLDTFYSYNIFDSKNESGVIEGSDV